MTEGAVGLLAPGYGGLDEYREAAGSGEGLVNESEEESEEGLMKEGRAAARRMGGFGERCGLVAHQAGWSAVSLRLSDVKRAAALAGPVGVSQPASHLALCYCCYPADLFGS